MLAKLKSQVAAWVAALISGAAAIVIMVLYFLAKGRHEGAEAVKAAANEKAEALRVAAGLVEKQTERQVAKVEAETKQDKAEDPVDFANKLIEEKKS